MGDCQNHDLRLGFDRRLKLKFLGSKVTTDAGLLAYRELDEALGLTKMADDLLGDSRLGSNKQHGILPLLRQSIYSRNLVPPVFGRSCHASCGRWQSSDGGQAGCFHQ